MALNKIPIVFLIDPHPFESDGILRFIRTVSNLEPYPVTREYTGNHPKYPDKNLRWGISLLLGRIGNPKTFLYLFAKSANQSLFTVLKAFYSDFRRPELIPGYVVCINMQLLQKGKWLDRRTEIDYVNCVQGEIAQLENILNQPHYIIALEVEEERQWNSHIESEVRRKLGLNPDVIIIPHQSDKDSVKKVLLALFSTQKVYTLEEANVIQKKLHNFY